jgi:hypothetical protein
MTTVQDTLYYADGKKANGQVVLNWPMFQSNGTAVAQGQQIYPIVDGQIQITLYPNTSAYPAGTYYTATFELEEGAVYEEYWIVPNVVTATLPQIRAAFPPAPGMFINSLQLSSGGAQPGQFLGWNGAQWVPMHVSALNISPNTIALTVTAQVAADISVAGSPAMLGLGLTLNIPDAGSVSRGVVTAGAQSFAGTKTFLNNVGIGAADPAFPLNVVGNINCTGAFSVNGTPLAPGGVTSVFARSGAVVAQASDYAAYYPALTGAYSDPAWITTLNAAKLTGVPPAAIIAATQTPWTQDINAASHNITNLNSLNSGGTKLGIGTTSPQVLLDLPNTNGSNSIARFGSMEFMSYTFNNSNWSDNLYFNGSTWVYRNNGQSSGYGSSIGQVAGQIIFYTAPSGSGNATLTERMHITNGGNVGIGTTNPQTLLAIGSGTLINTPVARTQVFIAGANSTASDTVPTGRVQLGLDQNHDYGAYIGSMNFATGASLPTGMVLGTRHNQGDFPAIYLRAGYVGIGTTNPQVLLDMPYNTGSQIRVGSLELEGYALNNCWIADNLYYGGNWTYRNAGYVAGLQFYQGLINFMTAPSGAAGTIATPTNRMQILNNGQVVINPGSGATVPHFLIQGGGPDTHQVAQIVSLNGGALSGWQAVNVNGVTLSLWTYGSDNGTQLITSKTSTTNPAYLEIGHNQNAAPILFIQNAAEVMRIAANGNVGIGTTSPQVLLDLPGYNNNNTIVRFGAMEFLAYALNNEYWTENLYFNSGNWLYRNTGCATAIGHSGGNISFTTVPSGTAGATISPMSSYERMRITNAGNVGIGTASPTSKLQVVGLPVYASDSAAGTGGLTAGAFYQDSTGGLHVKQ